MSHPNAILEKLRGLRPGKPVRHGALAVVPLENGGGVDAPRPYLTLEEATSSGAIAITESGAAGTVPLLLVHVPGEKPVLLLEGEVLLGCKQNRVLNTSVLAKARGVTEVPVSCVERRRWSRSSGAMSPGSVSSPSLRGSKSHSVTESLRKTVEGADVSARYASDQGEVWRTVDRKLQETATPSGTASFSAIFEARARSLGAALSELEAAFAAGAPVGAVALVQGKVIGADVFDGPRTLRRLGRRLLEGYAVDALDLPEVPADDAATLAEVRRFLERAGRGRVESFASPGLGTDHRVEGDGVRGFALEHAGEVLHLAAFPA